MLGLLACSGWPVRAGSTQGELASKTGESGAAFNAESSAPYSGSWECQYGDSPASDSGVPLWALSMARVGEWRACQPPGTPPGRGANNFLWMRTLLTGPDYHDPTLFLLTMDQIFEAYLDGKLVYRFGELNDPAQRHYAGHRPHYVPIGPDYQGKLLTLRIFSEHINIGIVGEVKMGSRLALTVATMRSGQDKLIVGALLMLIGLASLAVYATQRQEALYGSYGGFAVCIGVYIAVYSQTRTQELENTLGWNYLEVFALFLMAPCFLRFMIGLIGRGPWGLTSQLLKLHIGVVVLAVLAVATSLVPLMWTVVTLTYLLLSTSSTS